MIFRKKCKFCNPELSYGTETIYVCKDFKVFIAHERLKVLLTGEKIAENIDIKHCPFCKRKIKGETE